MEGAAVTLVRLDRMGTSQCEAPASPGPKSTQDVTLDQSRAGFGTPSTICYGDSSAIRRTVPSSRMTLQYRPNFSRSHSTRIGSDSRPIMPPKGGRGLTLLQQAAHITH